MTQRAMPPEDIFRKIAVRLIRLYQIFLSPALQFFCKTIGLPFGCKHPISCSEFAADELSRKPLLAATLGILRRILSCNPWSLHREKVS